MSESHLTPRPSLLRRLLASALIPLSLIGGGGGCSRPFFRERAEKEGHALMAEKTHPLWHLHGYHLAPDARSRFADSTDPDHPPMPPDDKAAQELSPNPQKPGKNGVTLVEGVGYLSMLDCWDKANRAELEAAAAAKKAERGEGTSPESNKEKDAPAAAGAPPDPVKVLERAEELARRELAEIVTTRGGLPETEAEAAVSRERTFLIKLDQAVELGLVNSREYQARRESLFLSALPVSVERFAFAPQFFATETVLRERFGRGDPAGFRNRWVGDTNFGFTKLFCTGALLLFRFANRTVFNIGTTPKDTSVSTISLDLVQPFLRGGGLAVTLEPLTQAERNLLYSVRDFAKFRQEFFVFIGAGQPSFIPGVEAGVSAITSGTVQTPGRFIPGASPVVTSSLALGFGPQVTPGDGGFFTSINPSGAPPQGYLSTLGEKAVLVNQYRNIQSLRRYLELFRVYLEGGIVNSVQVGQVEQQLLDSTATALSSQANFRSSIDQFKFQLGLPMPIRLDVDDGPLQPMFNVTRAFEEVSSQFETVSTRASQFVREDEVNLLRGRLRALLESSSFTRGTEFAKGIKARLDRWKDYDDKALEAALGRLTKQRDALRDRRDRMREADKGDLPAEDAERLERYEDELAIGNTERNLRLYEKRVWKTEKDEASRLATQNRLYNVVYRYFLAVLEEPFRERLAAVRKLWPELPSLCIDGVDLLRDPDDVVQAAATRAALANRLDLMNQRAQLVDSWRKIAVAANALLGTFNVEYHGETSTPFGQSKPFNFGYNRTRHQLAFNAEAPIVRIVEQNNYRAALIAYQQQRRALQLAEDNVIFAVRLELRQLRAAANNYHKVQKRGVELAYQQVDQALNAFSQPQAPAGPSAPPGSVGAPAGSGGTGDPAALTQQLLSSQNQLLRQQNGLYNTWINYLTTRMSLYRDLGVMPIDPRGVWIDDVAACRCRPESASTSDGRERGAGELPPPRPGVPGDNPGDGEPERLPEPRKEPVPVPPAGGR